MRQTCRRTTDFAQARPVLFVFVVALVLRVAVAGVLAFALGGSVFEDDRTYSRMAEMVVNGETTLWDDYTRNLYWATAAFSLPLTALYWLSGSTPVVGQLFVAVMGAGAAALTARVCSLKLGARWALLGGGIVALLPSLVLWSSLTLKDPAVWLVLTGLAVAVALANRYGGTRMVVAIAWIGVLLFALAFLRIHTMVVASWAIVLAAWLGSGDRRWRRGIAVTVLAVLIPLAVGAGPAGITFVVDQTKPLELRRVQNAEAADTAFLPPVLEVERVRQEVDALTSRADHLEEQATKLEEQALALGHGEPSPSGGHEEPSRGGSPPSSSPPPDDGMPTEDPAPDSGDSGKVPPEAVKDSQLLLAEAARLRSEAGQLRDVATAKVRERPHLSKWFGTDLDRELNGGLAEDLAALPRGLAVMLVEPLPWRDVDNTRMNLARVDSLLWWPVLLLALFALPQFWRNRDVLTFPVVAGVGICLMYALVEGNFGTAFRHRAEFVWAFAVLAAFGAQWVRLRWVEWRAVHDHG